MWLVERSVKPRTRYEFMMEKWMPVSVKMYNNKCNETDDLWFPMFDHFLATEGSVTWHAFTVFLIKCILEGLQQLDINNINDWLWGLFPKPLYHSNNHTVNTLQSNIMLTLRAAQYGGSTTQRRALLHYCLNKIMVCTEQVTDTLSILTKL